MRPPPSPRAATSGAATSCPTTSTSARLAELAGDGRRTRPAPPARRCSPAGGPCRRPTMPRPRALHQMNLLRELKMAHHGAAVLSQGLVPIEAMMVAQPYMAPVFGWEEPYPDAEPYRERWEQAEAATAGRHGHRAGRARRRRARRVRRWPTPRPTPPRADPLAGCTRSAVLQGPSCAHGSRVDRGADRQKEPSVGLVRRGPMSMGHSV